MVKTPRTRHSKTQREPVTIDLEPDQVKREAARPSEPEKASKPAGEATAASAATASVDKASAAKTSPEKTSAAKTAAEKTAADKGSSDKASPDKASAAKPEPGARPQDRQAAFGRPGSGGAGSASEAPKSAGSAPAGAAKAPRSGGAGSALVAGLAGGVIALALAAGLQWSGLLPGLKPDTRTPDPAIETLRQQVTALEAKLEDQQGAIAAGNGEEVNAALAQASDLAKSLDQRISDLGSELAALQQSVSSGAAGDGAGLEALSARLAKLEDSAEALPGDSGLGDTVQAVSGQVEELRAGLEKFSASADAAARDAAGNAAAIAGLTNEVETLKSKAEEGGEASRVALVIAATALKSAVERGTPFASELDTYTAVAPPSDAESLAPLTAHAASGVPSRAALAAQAPEVATRIVAAVNRTEGTDGGIIDNLMASARSLVVVRPVGSVEGEGQAAIAARMEAAVIANDYEKALAEYARLPDAGKQAAGGFADDLAARLAADQALDKALASALKGA